MSSGSDGRRGRPFVVAAPSGTGKTTVCRAALERDPRLRFSVSHTTRKPREGEREGIDYHFVRSEEFGELVRTDAFLEYAEYGGNLYGTSWVALEEPLAEGWDLVVEIEVQGARQFRDRVRSACFLFLLPPDMGTLRERLRGRGTDSEAPAPPAALHQQPARVGQPFATREPPPSLIHTVPRSPCQGKKE